MYLSFGSIDEVEDLNLGIPHFPTSGLGNIWLIQYSEVNAEQLVIYQNVINS